MYQFVESDGYQNMLSKADVIPNTTPDVLEQQYIHAHREISAQLVRNFKELFQRCFVVTVEPTSVQKVTGASEKGGKPKVKGKKEETQEPGDADAEDSKKQSKKSGPEFNVIVSFLCGQGLDCINAVTQSVTAEFYYEVNQRNRGVVSAQLKIPKATVETDGTIKFRKQKIMNFVRPTKTSKTDQVASERYRIVFKTNLHLQNPLVNITLETMSLPIAIITGSNQANHAHGALLWYCYNNDPYALSKQVQMTISKEKFVEMIQACFSYLDGRCLRDDEIHFLLQKLSKKRNPDITSVNFEEFQGPHNKTNQDQSLPFWRWIQSILNLIEFYLKRPWQDGIIHGFISREETYKLLRNEQAGVFLLRFSESVVIGDGQNKNLTGGIVAAFSKGDGGNAILSKPLTADTYFSKYSLGASLENVQDKNRTKSLLKKLYGSESCLKDIKTRYQDGSEKKQEKDNTKQDKNYPNCQEIICQVFDTFNLDDDDDDDDDDDEDHDNNDFEEISEYEGVRRKAAKRNEEPYSPGSVTSFQSGSNLNVEVDICFNNSSTDDLLNTELVVTSLSNLDPSSSPIFGDGSSFLESQPGVTYMQNVSSPENNIPSPMQYETIGSHSLSPGHDLNSSSHQYSQSGSLNSSQTMSPTTSYSVSNSDEKQYTGLLNADMTMLSSPSHISPFPQESSNIPIPARELTGSNSEFMNLTGPQLPRL